MDPPSGPTKPRFLTNSLLLRILLPTKTNVRKLRPRLRFPRGVNDSVGEVIRGESYPLS